MPFIIKNGKYYASAGSNVAEDIIYDNTESGLSSQNVNDALDEITEKVESCFQSASDGKALIASAITGKGIETDATATFETMANNIGNIETGILLPTLTNPATEDKVLEGYEYIDTAGNKKIGNLILGGIFNTKEILLNKLEDAEINMTNANMAEKTEVYTYDYSYDFGTLNSNKVHVVIIQCDNPFLTNGVTVLSDTATSASNGKGTLFYENDLDLKQLKLFHQSISGIRGGELISTIYVILIENNEEGKHFVDCDVMKLRYASYMCFVKGTKITLTDNKVKNVEDITYDDDLLVWNFDEGKYDSSKPLWIKKSEVTTSYYECVFENGIVLNLVGSNGNCHAIYNVDDNKFEYANNCVNKNVMTERGITRLLSCELKYETVEFYNIITTYHINCFANEVLTSSKLNNIYPIENMKFIKDTRKVLSIELFDGLSEDFYYGLRLSEHELKDIDWIKENIANKLNVMLEK